MRPTYIRKVPLLQQPLPPQPRPLVPLRADALGWAWGACPCQSPSPSLDPSSCPSTASALILSSKPRPCCRPVPKHLPTQSRNLRGPSAPRSMRLASASSPAGRGRGPPLPRTARGAAHAAPSSTLRERGDTPVEQVKGVGREVLRAPPRAAAPELRLGAGQAKAMAREAAPLITSPPPGKTMESVAPSLITQRSLGTLGQHRIGRDPNTQPRGPMSRLQRASKHSAQPWRSAHGAERG